MKFSVIIPVYNKADTVCAAVESVYAQTFREFEIIAVDDGSNDEPEKVLEDLQSPQLHLIRQENGGVSVARNTGIANSKGEFICFLDADDLWKPDHLETLASMINKYPQAEAFVTSHEIITPEGKLLHSSDALEGYDEDFQTNDLLSLLNTTSYSVVHTNSVCAKRALLEREGIRFEPGVKIGEDTDVWYRLGLKHPVAISKKETTSYRREYSTATSKSFNINDWIFSMREPTLISDDTISKEIKDSYLNLIDRYKMTCSREYMVAGDRKEAKKILAQVKHQNGKRYILSKLFTYLPYFVCRKLLKRK